MLRSVKPDDVRINDPLAEFSVRWIDPPKDVFSLFRKALEQAKREEDIQQFLQSKPFLLSLHLCGGHGRWVIPKQKLGSEYVTDFMVGERSSAGFSWQAVELESPLVPMFTKSGDPSRYLNHAIKQIQDWRAWLQQEVIEESSSEKPLESI